jgi:hypothetical protein
MRTNNHSSERVKASSPTTLVTARAKNAALALLAMTQFVIVIDAAVVNVAPRRSVRI